MRNSKASKRGLIIMKKRACLMTLLIPFLLWAGCSKKSTPAEGNGVLRLFLTDSIGSIEQVNLVTAWPPMTSCNWPTEPLLSWGRLGLPLAIIPK